MKRILLLLVSCIPLYADLGSGVVWEIRQGAGNDTNGGGWAPGAGTDMSQFNNKNATGCSSCQSATANLSTTDAVTNNTTTVTSATANFSSAVVNNVIYLAGTGTTTGWYQVVSVTNSTTIVVDRATGSTGGTGVTINIGGALATFASIINASTPAVVPGNTVYCTGIFAEQVALSPTGTSANPVMIRGYSGSRGSGGATISAAAARSFCITGPVDYWFWENMTFSGGTSWSIDSGAGAMRYGGFTNCKFDGLGSTPKATWNTSGGTWQGSKFTRCEFTGYALTGNGILRPSGSPPVIFDTCYFHGNTGNFFLVDANSSAGPIVLRSVFDTNNSGGSNGIFRINTQTDVYITSCTFRNNGGVQVDVQGGSYRITVENCLFASNTGRAAQGISGEGVPTGITVLSSAFYGSDTTIPNVYDGGGNVVLTASPFVSISPLDLRPNTTAGGGAALKGAAIGASFLGLSTTPATPLDIGAFQHADPTGGGSGGQHGYTHTGRNRPNRDLYDLLHPGRGDVVTWPPPTVLASAGVLIGLLSALRMRR